ncbi:MULTISPECIES: hypothetical protein [unclassified Streptomyces]|uniref:hypothetical protein n=1 Tax=unclassified Streptomyces TaxID=2593676 RepID=UPI0029ADD4F3|nr:hypothetical protein [Streptomyces sp. FL07-04A]MDX3575385.1 hypothetical protein [Streptomyces sp. FL07-04A]
MSATRRRYRRILPLAAALLVLGFTVPETATGAQAGHGDVIVATEHIQASAARVVTPRGNAQSEDSREAKGALRTETARQLGAPRDVQPQKRPDIGGQETSPARPPAVRRSFEGLNQGTLPDLPPDTHGAVGLRHFVEVTNGTGLGIFRKSDGVNVATVSFASFFGYTTTRIFDPRVVYDKQRDRWIVVAEAFPEPNTTVQNVFLAVSTTSDPTGSFFVYRMDVPEGTDFFDYPQLGLNEDAVIITGSIFDPTDAYLRTRAFGIPKSAVYRGVGFSVPYFNLGNPGTVAPPIVEDRNPDAFLLSASVTAPGALRLFRARGLGTADATIAPAVDVPVPTFAAPPAARQPGATDRLDALDGRFQNASTQIGDQLLNVHTIATGGGGFPTPRWYQIDTTTATVPAGRSGLVLESGDSDDFNPAVVGSSVGRTGDNPIGRMFFTWSATDVLGADVHQARVKGASRFATDPVNVTGGTTFAEATAPYNPTPASIERWGDYSAVTIDPVRDQCRSGHGQSAWLVNERHTTPTQWGSRIGRLGHC